MKENDTLPSMLDFRDSESVKKAWDKLGTFFCMLKFFFAERKTLCRLEGVFQSELIATFKLELCSICCYYSLKSATMKLLRKE